MGNFNTYQGALDIFRRVNYVGQQENCIIGGHIDISRLSSGKRSMIGYAFGGVVGDAIGYTTGMSHDLEVSKLNGYQWILLNQTEYGIGIMPLVGKTMKMVPEKLEPVYNDFEFYSFQDLTNIEVRNFMGRNKKVQEIHITLANNNKLHFTACVSEQYLVYQEACMARFMGRYKK